MVDFQIIKNSIDTNIEIIEHIKTGYYNITKIANYINETKTGKQKKTIKRIGNWFRTQDSIELIETFKNITNIDNLQYVLDLDIEFKYKGTYVHRYLYEHILMWIDKSYAIKISIILDEQHKAYNLALVSKNKDLSTKMDKLANQSIELADQKNYIKQILADSCRFCSKP
jgi:hypothetical protein